MVYPPSYVPPQNSQELVPEDLTTFELESQGDNIFRSMYDGFDEVGTYRLAIYAQDNDNLKARLMVLNVPDGVVGTGERVKSFLPIIQR